ncbi:hypothetical protein PV326_003179, partial [Microctonus aethiopoides]
MRRGIPFLCREPVGSKAPALTGILKGGWMRQNSASHIVLTCPAQGYPVPAFRDGGYRKMKSQALLCQPVGTKAPAFMGEMKGWWFAKVEKSTVVMSCPAQAYPVPAFSKAPAFTGEMKASWWLDKRVKSSLVMPCPAQGFPVPAFSKAPAVIGELRGGWKAKAASTSVVMSCPAQGYPVPNFRKAPSIQGEEGSSMKRRGGMDIVIPCHDPAGRVSPKFPKSAKTNSFEVSNGIETTLLCDAQAFPTPAFRLKLTLFHRSEPVGKVSPKFPRSAKSESFDVITGKELRMLCDAQAYPAPTFRSFFVSFACVYVEPVNGAAPRIPPTAKITVLTSSVTSPVTMLCQAQANPIPIFSGPPRLPPRSKFDALLKPQEMSLTLLCEAQASPPPFYSVFRYYRDNITEPSGSVPPNVRDKEVNGMKRILHVGQTVGLTCPVQGFPAPLFSNVAPRVAGERYEGGKLVGVLISGVVALDCAVQGSPVPVISNVKVAPRMSGKKFEGGEIVQLPQGQSLALGHSLQGNPTPISRSNGGSLSSITTSKNEPSGHTVPKSTGDGLNKYHGVVSESLALACSAQGFPAPISRWYKFIEGTTRRQPVQLNERVRQVSGTLIIREARVEDSGKYLCIVNNSVGGESVETVLTVTAPLGSEIEPRTQTVDFGRPATFTCNVRGNPIKTISWMKDGKPLGHEDAVLRIESVKKEDKGMYQCFVRNDQESAQSTAELKLGGRFEPPQIKQAFTEETLQPGPSMFLKCVASGNPTPEITWELDGKRLSNTERLQVGQYVKVNGDVVSHLNISSIHTNDGGLYKCIAASKVGATEHSARLNVYGLPFIRHMDKKAIVAGETLRVTCPVAGYPIESIVWERDTRVLPINRKQKVFPNGTLIIENVERHSDQATYTCVARNAQGYSARGTLEVQVM